MSGTPPAPPVAHQHTTTTQNENWSFNEYKGENTEKQTTDMTESTQQRPLPNNIPYQVKPRIESNNITLWQFLLDLLDDPSQRNLIVWTGQDGEFKLLNAEEVARMWGRRKNKNNMNYDKLSRALRYYYDKNIIKKVMGQKFVYKFVSYPDTIGPASRPRIEVRSAPTAVPTTSTLPSPSSYSGIATTVIVKQELPVVTVTGGYNPLERPGDMIIGKFETKEERLVPLDCSVKATSTSSRSPSPAREPSPVSISKSLEVDSVRERSPVRSSPPPPYPTVYIPSSSSAYVTEARMHNEPKLVDSSERPIIVSTSGKNYVYTTSPHTVGPRPKSANKPKPVQLTVPPIICATQQTASPGLTTIGKLHPNSPSYLNTSSAVTALHTPALPATPIMVASPLLGQGGTPLLSHNGTPLVHLWGTFSPLPISPSVTSSNTFQFPTLVNGLGPSGTIAAVSGVPMQPLTPVLLSPPSSKAIIVT